MIDFHNLPPYFESDFNSLLNIFNLLLVSLGNVCKYLTLTGTIWAQPPLIYTLHYGPSKKPFQRQNSASLNFIRFLKGVFVPIHLRAQ
jgi:hypothetical protein